MCNLHHNRLYSFLRVVNDYRLYRVGFNDSDFMSRRFAGDVSLNSFTYITSANVADYDNVGARGPAVSATSAPGNGLFVDKHALLSVTVLFYDNHSCLCATKSFTNKRVYLILVLGF